MTDFTGPENPSPGASRLPLPEGEGITRNLIDVAAYCNIFVSSLVRSMLLVRTEIIELGQSRIGGSEHMKRTLALLVVCALLIAVAPLSAHHSTAMYTGSKTVTGKVVKFEWTNPHA